MIVEMHKYLIYGKREEMNRFFELAQRGGFLEFIGKKKLELPEEAKVFFSAIKIAKQHIVHPELSPHLPAFEIAHKLISLQTQFQTLEEKKRILSADIAHISVFGEFSKEDLDQVMREAKRVIQFFCVKSEHAPVPPDLIYVGTDLELDYYISIAKELVHHPKMIELFINQPVQELRQELAQVQEKLKQVGAEIRLLSNALPHLQQGLFHYLNEHHLRLAKHDATLNLGDTLFAIEAWVPATKVKALFALISTLLVSAEEIAIEGTERIPTCMENRGAFKVGEDLVHIYDTPAYTDKDPSMWILVFFSLFFAMIVSDAGYGLLYLALILGLKWKFRKAKGAVKRFFKLGIILSCACIGWGAVTASYFGIEIGPNNPLRKTSFLHYFAVKKSEYHLRVKDDVYEEIVKEYPAVAGTTNGHDFLLAAKKTVDGRETYPVLDEFYGFLLLELSLLIGSVHIILSLLRYVRRSWPNLGWVLFIIGGYLWFPEFVNATSFIHFLGWISKPIAFMWGKWLLFTGLGVFCAIGFVEKKWAIFADLPNALQIFSDVLSYLRLYALALAGVIMAGTFNTMGLNIGFPAGILVLVLGHLINSSMTIMSGTIHGFRLNILEWYHYSFEGNGKLFNPLRILR